MYYVSGHPGFSGSQFFIGSFLICFCAFFPLIDLLVQSVFHLIQFLRLSVLHRIVPDLLL